MCGGVCDQYGLEEAIKSKLAELFKEWIDYCLVFHYSTEEIKNNRWIENFLSIIPKALRELKERNDYSDIFKIRCLYENNPEVFEICFKQMGK